MLFVQLLIDIELQIQNVLEGSKWVMGHSCVNSSVSRSFCNRFQRLVCPFSLFYFFFNHFFFPNSYFCHSLHFVQSVSSFQFCTL